MAPNVTDTKTRILDVAEELFGNDGLDRVSIRDITEAAGVNLAAVNYHYGSKEDLIEAVFKRRLEPLNMARLNALEQVENKAKKELKVEDVLGAFIRPALAHCAASHNGPAFAKLFGRCIAEPRPEMEAFLMKQFEPLLERFEPAFIKALPHLSKEDVFWKMKFTFGALHHWLLTRDRFQSPAARKTPVEEQVNKLISFAAAGFAA